MIKIAVLKPHHGPVGGFERVVARVENILDDAGYDVTRHSVDMTRAMDRFPSDRPRTATEFELNNYLFGRDQFDGISTAVYDLVISTSPPSYVHQHRAHLALFYHHHRVFYDLEDLFVEAGFAQDPERHHEAARMVRELDHDRFRAVTTFLCPSETVQERLRRFNDRRDTRTFHAGIGIDGSASPLSEAEMAQTSGVLCVSRHEFPKRTELTAAAAHLIDRETPVTITGTGGRLGFARNLDAELSAGTTSVADLTEKRLWRNNGQLECAEPSEGMGRVDFVGHVSDTELDRLFARSRCVVAPAYDEDYGLTAIEAMARARPVVACRDGGGLAELVIDGETGFVVDPDPASIADAITRLHEDPSLAARLGRNAFERARTFHWDNAARQLLDAVEATLDG